MNIVKKIALILSIVCVAVFSVTVVTPWYTNVENHKETISQIDSEIGKVMGLTAASTGVSAALSLFPDDQCTPIANQFAEFSKYFLIVLSALTLEKYLLTTLGYIMFKFIIPGACGLLIVWAIAGNDTVRRVALKMLVGSIAIVLLIPISTRISGLIQETYDTSIEETIQEADRISFAQDSEDDSWFEKFTQWLSNAAVTVSDYVTNLLSRFVQAIAVMLVTACIIPILVIVIFIWIIKTLFGIQIPVSAEKVVRVFGKTKPNKDYEVIEADTK